MLRLILCATATCAGVSCSQPPLTSGRVCARAVQKESPEPLVLKGHTASVVSVAWSPDGSALASCRRRQCGSGMGRGNW